MVRKKAHKGRSEKQIFQVFVALMLVVGLIFFKHQLSVIILAFITVLIFNPVYNYFRKIFKRKNGLPLGLTMLAIFSTFVIPVLFVLSMTIAQVRSVANDFSTNSIKGSLVDEFIDEIAVRGNEVTDRFNIDYTFEEAEIKDRVTEALQQVGITLLNFLKEVGLSAPQALTTFVIYVFLLLYIFPNQSHIKNAIYKISPFENKINTLFFHNSAEMARSMVKGTLIIAIAQGILGAIFLWIAGIDYIFFFAVLLTFLSIIPLGGGIVTLPIGIALLATGNVWAGVFVILTHILIITNVDNVLRPKLVSRSLNVPSVLVLISIFAGIGWFGFFGFVFGPMIMVIVYTALSIYVKEYNIKEDYES